MDDQQSLFLRATRLKAEERVRALFDAAPWLLEDCNRGHEVTGCLHVTWGDLALLGGVASSSPRDTQEKL